MPRYHFDVRVGSSVLIDEEGQDLSSPAAASSEAEAVAMEIALYRLPGQSERWVSVEVRQEAGPAILEAVATLSVRWLDR